MFVILSYIFQKRRKAATACVKIPKGVTDRKRLRNTALVRGIALCYTWPSPSGSRAKLIAHPWFSVS